MNELIEYKSWWERNWKWVISVMIVVFIGLGLISNSKVGESVTDITRAYSDASIYENALDLAQKNEQIKKLLGVLKPIDNMAIIEGSVIYSNSNNSVDMSLRIKGSKGKGKIDISADRNELEWNYSKINIRIKEPRQTIKILK